MSNVFNNPAVQNAHQQAVSAGQEHYVCPETGYTVMTALFLKNRGFCCHCGCRHCPYGDPKSPATQSSDKTTNV
ncbi:MAG: DUF5522 domain-containing protein [Candidatus Melainabacteria bacterium]|nr:DUF5522 domain-containing protein [Candidatus Melainabacteria bacterium]